MKKAKTKAKKSNARKPKFRRKSQGKWLPGVVTGQISNPSLSKIFVAEGWLSPGRLGAIRGKNFEALVLDDLKTWFRGRHHSMDSSSFAEEMVPYADKRKLIIVKHYFSTYRTDLLIINPKNKKRLVIECRYYSGPGSMEERFGDFFFKAQNSGIDTIVVRGGLGWSDRTIDRALSFMPMFKRVKEMFNRDEERLLIKKYIKLYLKVK